MPNETTNNTAGFTDTRVNNTIREQIRQAHDRLENIATQRGNIGRKMQENLAAAGDGLGLSDVREFDKQLHNLEIEYAKAQGALLELQNMLYLFDLQ